MAVILLKLKRNSTVVLTLIWCLSTRCTDGYESKIQDGLAKFLSKDAFELTNGVTIKRDTYDNARGLKSDSSSYELMLDQMQAFKPTHRVGINLSKLVPSEKSFETARFSFGKNSFLTGFGLGFLAFGLKKLLLPIFIGVQIVKSILIAMFLPSILGSVGKLVGKGVSTFAQSSGASNFGAATNDNINDFDFKDPATGQASTNFDTDTAGSDTGYSTVWTYPTSHSATNQLKNSNNMYAYPDASNYPQQSTSVGAAAPSFSPINWSSLVTNNAAYNDYATTLTKPTIATWLTPKPTDNTANKYYSGSFYTKDKTENFKEFHNIPSSSQLLTNYDPFYSPLLSRMDSVFKQLGYSTEICRERLVCNMYRNPAKYAPFSNLASAQLSRELNELRKPSTDNPEILRFFRYMKAAKDGQDGQECDDLYSECTTTRAASENAPMVSTYNEINKLVLARSL